MILERVTQSENSWIIFDAGRLQYPTRETFLPDAWAEHEVGRASGRAAAIFIDAPELGPLVLRHYHRGGLPGRISRDRYVYRGLAASRPFREFRILCQALQDGLPVPAPVAAAVHREGLRYRGDILMTRIPNARSLADLLAQDAECDWPALARAIGVTHRAGYWHADLNARNVIWDGRRWTLIDWDRGEKRAPGAWGAQNIRRLQRSLDKLQAHGELDYDLADWNRMLEAYRATVVG